MTNLKVNENKYNFFFLRSTYHFPYFPLFCIFLAKKEKPKIIKREEKKKYNRKEPSFKANNVVLRSK